VRSDFLPVALIAFLFGSAGWGFAKAPPASAPEPEVLPPVLEPRPVADYENACVPDLPAALRAISPCGEKLRVHTSPDLPDGTMRFPLGILHGNFNRHLQGIARLPGGGLAMTGNAKNGAFLYLARMDAQPAEGAWQGGDSAANRFVRVVHLSKADYHPGGVQAAGSLLATPMDAGDHGPSEIRFLDVSDPARPAEFHHLRVTRANLRAESVGITRLIGEHWGPARGRYLLVASHAQASHLTFYLSRGEDPADLTNGFEEIGVWKKGDGGVKLPNYQALQLASGCDGQVFLLGSYGTLPLYGKEYVDAYRLELAEKPRLRKALRKRLRPDDAYLNAGGGLYIDPRAGALSYLATDYWPLDPLSKDTVYRFQFFGPAAP
jgi:hypothetical protein